jgi:homoserine kinase
LTINTSAYAPASMGNMGIGFDILGLAFEEPGDEVRAELRSQSGVEIVEITGDGGRLPREAHKNTASVAVMAYLHQIGMADCGVALWLKKGLPLASGLGSSAASAVAAVFAVNALLDNRFTREELLPACLEGEALVSGHHADNVGPCLFGGITLITGVDQIQRLPVPADMHLALVTPDVEVPTAEARAVLPVSIPLATMVHQTGGVALLVDALYRGDLAAVAAAMAMDQVIEPARAHLMPYFQSVREQAIRAGALVVVISGAGPTLCAVCDSAVIAAGVAETMQAAYTEVGINAVVRHTRVDPTGVRIVRS